MGLRHPGRSGRPVRCLREALAIRSDRAKAPGITYTSPYMLIYDVITVRNDSGINTIDDLKGKTIASNAPAQRTN